MTLSSRFPWCCFPTASLQGRAQVPSLPTSRLAGCNSGGWAETPGPLVLMSSAPTLMCSSDVMGAELCS